MGTNPQESVNRLIVGRYELGHFEPGCFCGACEDERIMAKQTMKTIAILVIVIVAAAFAYKNWTWIKSKINRGEVL